MYISKLIPPVSSLGYPQKCVYSFVPVNFFSLSIHRIHKKIHLTMFLTCSQVTFYQTNYGGLPRHQQGLVRKNNSLCEYHNLKKRVSIFSHWLPQNLHGFPSPKNVWLNNNNKRPIGHIAHLRKQFKSMNTYDNITTLIQRRENPIIYY